MGAARKLAPAAVAPPDEIKIQARTWAQEQLTQALALREGCRDIAVTAETIELVNGFLRDVCRAKDAIEEKRKSFTTPLNAVLRQLNDEFRPAREALEAVERQLKAAIGAYRVAELATQRAAYELAARAMQANEPRVLTEALAVAEQAGPAELAGTSVREVWTAEVIAPDLLPETYTKRVPDVERIDEAASSTPADKEPTPIPGVKFVKKQIVTVRR